MPQPVSVDIGKKIERVRSKYYYVELTIERDYYMGKVDYPLKRRAKELARKDCQQQVRSLAQLLAEQELIVRRPSAD